MFGWRSCTAKTIKTHANNRKIYTSHLIGGFLCLQKGTPMDIASLVVNVAGHGLSQVQQELNRLSGDASKVTKAADRMKQAIHGVGAIAAGIVTNSILQTANSMQEMNNQLRVATHSTEEYTHAQAAMERIAMNTSSSLEAVAGLYTSNSRALKSLNKTQDETLLFTENITKAMAQGGASAEAQSAALTQLGQAMSSGVLRGDEFNSIAEQSPVLLQLLCDKLNMTAGELRKFAFEGGITSEIVYDAVAGATDKLDAMAGKTVKTMAQGIQNVKTQWLLMTDFLINSESGVGVGLAQGINGVALAMQKARQETDKYLKSKEGIALVAGVTNGLKLAWDNLSASIQQSGLTDIFSSIFDNASQSFSDLSTKIPELVNKFAEFLNSEAVVAALTTAVEGLKLAWDVLVAVFYTVAAVLAPIIEFFKEHEKVSQSLATAIGIVAGAFVAYNIAMGIAAVVTGALAGAFALLTSPIAVTLITLTALVAAAVYVYKNFDELKAKLSEVFNGLPAPVQAAMQLIWGNIKASFDIIATIFSTGWQVIKAIFTGNWGEIPNIVGTGMSKVWSILSERFEAIKSFIGVVWDSIKSTVTGVWDGINAAIAEKVTAVKEFLSGIWDSIKQKAIEVFASLPEPVQGAVYRIMEVFSFFAGIWDTLSSGASGALAIISGKSSEVSASVMAVWTPIQTFFTVLWNSFAAAAAPAWDAVKSIVGTGVEFIKTVISVGFNAFLAIVNAAWEGVSIATSLAWDGIKIVVGTAITALALAFNLGFDVIKSVFATAWQVIKAIFTGNWSAIPAIVSTGMSQLASIITAHFQTIKGYVVAAWDAIKTAITTKIDAIKEAAQASFEALKAGITAKVEAAKQAIVSKFEVMKASAVTKLNEMKNAVVSALQGLPAKMLQIGTDVVNGLVNGIKSGAGRVGEAARNLANSAMDAMKGMAGFDTHSPSKKTHAVGGDVGQGLANGIRSKKQAVKTEAQKLAEVAMNSINDTISGLKRDISLFGNNDPIAAMQWDRENTTKYAGVGDTKFNEAKDLTRQKGLLELGEKFKATVKSISDSISNASVTTELQKWVIALTDVKNELYGLSMEDKLQILDKAADADFSSLSSNLAKSNKDIARQIELLGVKSSYASDLLKIDHDANDLLEKYNFYLEQGSNARYDEIKAAVLGNAEQQKRLLLLKAQQAANDTIYSSIEGINKQLATMNDDSAMGQLWYDLTQTDKYANASEQAIDALLKKVQEMQLLKDKQSAKDAYGNLKKDMQQESPMGKLIAEYEQHREVINNAQAMEVIDAQTHADTLLAIDKSFIEQKRNLMMTQYESLFGGLAGIAKSFAGEQSTIYRALFAIEKGFAIAQAAIAIQQSIAKAMAVGVTPVDRAMNIANAVSQGATIVSNIKAIAMPVGQAHDGIMSVPKSGTWNLEKGERVLPAHTAKAMDAKLENGGNQVNITVNVDAKGNAEMDAQNANAMSKQLANSIKAVVNETLRKERRQGGLLSA